jgi:hypothetical protein
MALKYRVVLGMCEIMMDFWLTQARQLTVSQGIHRNIKWYLQVLENLVKITETYSS